MDETYRAKLKISLDVAGLGSVVLDGVDISRCVNAIEFKGQAGQLTEVRLTIHADVDADIEAKLDQIALKKNEQEQKTVRLADGRILKVRERVRA